MRYYYKSESFRRFSNIVVGVGRGGWLVGCRVFMKVVVVMVVVLIVVKVVAAAAII